VTGDNNKSIVQNDDIAASKNGKKGGVEKNIHRLALELDI